MSIFSFIQMVGKVQESQLHKDQTISHPKRFYFFSPGGIPARNHKGERLLLYLGIIDILQSYRMRKKLEHTFKAFIHDGVSIMNQLHYSPFGGRICRVDHYLYIYYFFIEGHRISSPTRLLCTSFPRLHGR